MLPLHWSMAEKNNTEQAMPWRLLHEILTLVSLGACPHCRTTCPTPHHLEPPSKCEYNNSLHKQFIAQRCEPFPKLICS